jgi:hypothetical protein
VSSCARTTLADVRDCGFADGGAGGIERGEDGQDIGAVTGSGGATLFSDGADSSIIRSRFWPNLSQAEGYFNGGIRGGCDDSGCGGCGDQHIMGTGGGGSSLVPEDGFGLAGSGTTPGNDGDADRGSAGDPADTPHGAVIIYWE